RPDYRSLDLASTSRSPRNHGRTRGIAGIRLRRGAGTMAKGKDCEDKSSFDAYREGGSTREIRFTVQLVLVARRWRALLDEKLRPIDQSSARMEAMSAIMNSPGPNSQIDIAKRLRIEGPT